MKQLIAILAFAMFASQAQAQQYAPQGVAQQLPQATAQATTQGTYGQAAPAAPQAPKRTVIYDERTNELVEVTPQVQAQQAQAEAVQASPIYILNNQRYQGYQGTQQAAIQEQPTALIQEAPLKQSAADGMRKQRQETEAQTEDGIVQALEKARIDDEMKRRDRFNNAISTGPQATPTPAPIYVAPPAPQAYQQVVPAPMAAPQQKIEFVEKAEKEDKVDVKSEIRAALREAKDEEIPTPVVKSQTYVSGLVGIGTYPDVVNVRGNVATGVAVGVVTPERVIAEGAFIYGTYELEDLYRSSHPMFPRIVDMKQMNFTAAVKYQLLPGKFRPNAGALASYTRRQYSERDYEFRTSDAFDAGFTAGADIALTEQLSVGFDFRYLWNVASKNNSNYQQSFVYQQARNSIEDLEYYTATAALKFNF